MSFKREEQTPYEECPNCGEYQYRKIISYTGRKPKDAWEYLIALVWGGTAVLGWEEVESVYQCDHCKLYEEA